MSALFCSHGSVRAQQQPIRTIEIGLLSTTHLLFTSDLTYVDISMPKFILAKVVDASKNMLAIKAKEKFDFVTTISALEANGTMHTFYVKFNADPEVLVIDTRVQDQSVVAQVNTQIRPDGGASGQPVGGAQGAKSGKDSNGNTVTYTPTGVTVTTDQTSNFGRANAPTLEEVIRKERSLYHLMDRSYGLTAYVTNVYAYSDLTYIVLTIENNSDIGYESGDAQFTIENKRINGKMLTGDKDVSPKSSYGTLSCAPNSKTSICYSIPKFTLMKNQVLKVYVYEKGGSRNMVLILDDTDINYAVSPV